MIAHIALFWGGDIVRTFKLARVGKFNDPHHVHMHKNYKDAPWWWYVVVLVVSFILGLIVVIKENITLPVWAYIIALIMGVIIAPFVSSRIILSFIARRLILSRARSFTLASAMVSRRTICPRS